MPKAGVMRMLISGNKRRIMGLALWVAGLAGFADPAHAYLYWSKPKLASAPAVGGEPGITLPMPGAQPNELQAGLVWTMRAGLNVAALQCQFAPALRTVDNYNNMLRQHAAELQQTYATLGNYFKRVSGKTWQTALDAFTTKTYNSFSTLQAQRSFCEVASAIGQETLERPKGQLGAIAIARLREFRNSLTPMGDMGFAGNRPEMNIAMPNDLGEPACYDKKGRVKACKRK